MKRYDIVTIGSATRDVFLRSRGIKIIRDDNFSTGEAECFALGSKIEIDELVFETGGGGSNTAVGFARQGFRTGFIGKIGASDARGREILQALHREKVDIHLIRQDQRQQTGYSVLLLTPRGERTVLVYRGASADFTSSDLPRRTAAAKWLYVSSLGGELTMLRQVWLWARATSMHIAWNPGAGELALGFARLRPFLAQADIVLLNQEEAAGLMNQTRDQEAETFHRLRSMLPGVTVVTEGVEGSLAGTPNAAWQCGTHQVKVIDTTGAGDAFGCGFVGSFIRHGNIPRAMQFATENSESVIAVVGAKPGLLRRPSRRRPARVTTLKN